MMDERHGAGSVPLPHAVLLDLPFRGSWRVENSPARRVPSHGTHAFGTSHAIDFVAVDDDGRSTPFTWRSLVAGEAPEVFLGFGQSILAPVPGTVVIAHDGEPDHVGRRSQLTPVPYLRGQARRARRGATCLAGNHVVIAIGARGPFVLLGHLHVQVTDSTDWPRARGLPLAFRDPAGSGWVPAESEVVRG